MGENSKIVSRRQKQDRQRRESVRKVTSLQTKKRRHEAENILKKSHMHIFVWFSLTLIICCVNTVVPRVLAALLAKFTIFCSVQLQIFESSVHSCNDTSKSYIGMRGFNSLNTEGLGMFVLSSFADSTVS